MPNDTPNPPPRADPPADERDVLHADLPQQEVASEHADRVRGGVASTAGSVSIKQTTVQDGLGDG